MPAAANRTRSRRDAWNDHAEIEQKNCRVLSLTQHMSDVYSPPPPSVPASAPATQLAQWRCSLQVDPSAVRSVQQIGRVINLIGTACRSPIKGEQILGSPAYEDATEALHARAQDRHWGVGDKADMRMALFVDSRH